MRTSVIREHQVWDVVVSRKAHMTPLMPVWLCRFDRETKERHRVLLCQVQNDGRFGWTVVVAGQIIGLRLVAGFKQRWQAIRYAIDIREDLNKEWKEANGRTSSKMLTAVEHWYNELVRIGHHTPYEEISDFRSDRWPPEVDLLQAFEEWKDANGYSSES